MPTIEPTIDTPSDKSGARIREMFAGVAPRYDLLNHLLSGALDIWWRKRSAAALNLQPDEEVLDLCSGTGDQACEMARRGARVVAADFCFPMLVQTGPKLRKLGARPRLATADALALPFAASRFSAATVSFGLRNVADLDLALTEIARVLRPGGRVAFLEFALPEQRLYRSLYLFYFKHVLPRIGALLSPRGSAYAYLPSSVLEFPQRRDFTAKMERAGLTAARWRDLSFGTVCLYTGTKEDGV